VATFELFAARSHATFEGYADKVLGLSRDSAYQYMRVSEAFSEAMVESYGVDKLDRLLRSIAAAVEERPGMTSKAGWERIGDAGAWKNTTVGVGSKGRLFTVESSGKRYATSGRTGGWDEAGSGYNTQHLATLGGHLYSVEESGVLYKTNLSTGEWEEYGSADDFGATQLLFGTGKDVYSIEENGNLYKLDL